jgi:hypothetical protein
MKPVIVIVLGVLALGPAVGVGDEPEIPFHLPVLEGWRTETIPFPLEFAPEIDYTGLEELRFAPGMFEADADDFWSYAFVWWIPTGSAVSAETLKHDLEAYFDGLASAVGKARGFDPGDARAQTDVHPILTFAAANPTFEGTVATFDPFVTRGMVRLNLQVELFTCSGQEMFAVFFALSPQAPGHPVWRELSKVREGFSCQVIEQRSKINS